MMPLHDRTEERDAIKGRMPAIEKEMERLGDISSGPGHYALGRGWLALRDYGAARHHLERAMDMDYSRPGVSYALGMTLGRLYQRDLTIARRIENDDLRDARSPRSSTIFEIRRWPCCAPARTQAVEAPHYAEALISFYGGHLEEALEATRGAFRPRNGCTRPSFSRRISLSKWQPGCGSTGTPTAHSSTLAEADEAYNLAADIARSDPSIYEGQCALWTQIMDIRSRRGEDGGGAI